MMVGESNADVNVSLGFCSSNMGDDFVRFEIEDDVSGIQLVYLEIPHADFTKLLSSQYLHIKGRIAKRLDLIGKKKENKTVKISTVTDDGEQLWGNECMDLVRERAKQWEVDGWKADAYCLKSYNGHKHKDQLFTVIFRRHVEVEK